MTERARVPAGTYRSAAVALTHRDGEFDSYTLADYVGDTLGRYVSYKSAGAWIRRAYRANGSELRRVAGPIRARVVDGGRPTSYAVTEVTLRGLARKVLP